MCSYILYLYIVISLHIYVCVVPFIFVVKFSVNDQFLAIEKTEKTD